MGICLSTSSTTKSPPSRKQNTNPSNRWSRVRSSSTTKRNDQDAMIHEHAKAAVEMLLQQQQQTNGGVGLTFDRSTSLRHVGANSKRYQPLPRSSSSRARLGTDPLVPVEKLLNQVCWLYVFHVCSLFLFLDLIISWFCYN